MSGARPLRCGEVRRRLDDLVDGRLAPSVAAAVGEHLAGCAACRAEADALAALAARARRLPRDVAPPPALWAAIDAALPPRRAPRRVPRALQVAAALALVVATATVAAILTRDHDEATARKMRPRGEAATAAVEGALPREAEALLRALAARDLPPEERAAFEARAAAADSTIAALRALVAEDPWNEDLAVRLRAAWEWKIEILEEAAGGANPPPPAGIPGT